MGTEHSDSEVISVCEPAIGDERLAEAAVSQPVELGNHASRPWAKHCSGLYVGRRKMANSVGKKTTDERENCAVAEGASKQAIKGCAQAEPNAY